LVVVGTAAKREEQGKDAERNDNAHIQTLSSRTTCDCAASLTMKQLLLDEEGDE
jgi:hypothetical protein